MVLFVKKDLTEITAMEKRRTDTPLSPMKEKLYVAPFNFIS